MSKCRIKGVLGADALCGSIMVKDGVDDCCGFYGPCEHKIIGEEPRLCWKFTMKKGDTITTTGRDYQEALNCFPINRLHSIRKVESYDPIKLCPNCKDEIE